MALDKSHKDEELGYLNFRKMAWENERDYKLEEARKRRESTAGRLDKWRDERKTEKEEQEIKQLEERSLFEIQWKDWRDVEEYKRKQCAKNRESLAGRWNKFRQDRAYENQVQNELQEAREYEAELKDQAMEDMRKYEQKLREERRQSFALRLEQARRDHSYKESHREAQRMAEMEELRLRRLGNEDADRYMRTLQEAKRQSFCLRNQMAVSIKLHTNLILLM